MPHPSCSPHSLICTHTHTHALAQRHALAQTHTHTHTQIFHLAYVLQLPVPPSVGFIPFASTFTPFKISFYLNFPLSFANMQYVKVISSNFIAHLKLHEFFLSFLLSLSLFPSFYSTFFQRAWQDDDDDSKRDVEKKVLETYLPQFRSLSLSLSLTHTHTCPH